MAPHVVRPVAPDGQRVAEELLQVVALRPQHEERDGEPAPGGAVGLLVLAVDREPGPVVLEHGAHHLRTVHGLATLGEVLSPHLLRVAVVPRVRVGADHPFRRLGLGEEEPVVPGRRELRRHPVEMLDDREAVEEGVATHGLGMVHRQPEGRVAAAVVPDEVEPLVPEPTHESQDVGRHRALRRLGVVGPGRGRRRAAVPAQVGHDDRAPPLGEQRRDPVPGGAGARVAVEQHDRRPLPAVTDVDARLADLDVVDGESFEHVRRSAGQAFARRFSAIFASEPSSACCIPSNSCVVWMLSSTPSSVSRSEPW